MDTQYIRPSADLRNKYGEISQLCKETREPVYITVNGRGDTVIMDIADYTVMRRELELLQELAQSEADIHSGRTVPADDVYREIRGMLQGLKNG